MKSKTIKEYILIILLTLNLVTSCGKVDEATANGGFELRDLYGYQCITNGQGIWCN